jgi:hypothetical protein
MLVAHLRSPDPASLLGQADWSGIPELTAFDRARTYLCRCAVTSVWSARSILTEDERAPILPWRCSGHPAQALPAVLDGVQIPAEPTALAALAADALARRVPAVVPWPPSAEGHPAMWWDALSARYRDGRVVEADARELPGAGERSQEVDDRGGRPLGDLTAVDLDRAAPAGDMDLETLGARDRDVPKLKLLLLGEHCLGERAQAQSRVGIDGPRGRISGLLRE